MIFNSIAFAIFFLVLFILYWTIPGKKPALQNLLLVFASFFFYGWWDWRFLALLAGSSLFNYVVGIKINSGKDKGSRKGWLLVGLTGNVGVLVFYKYLDFFMVSFTDPFRLMGIQMNVHSMHLIVPLGISFLTFIAISYLVDVYRNQFQAEKNVVNLTLSLIFFPIILAGPIQRPSTLLPQICKPRTFDFGQAADGLRQILWGLFVKMVVADNLASSVNIIFPEKGRVNGITLALGAIMFSIQIYADFSAYSNMAIGTARLLGFHLMQNFRYPYFALNIADFWKRWHISLTTWFRDYIFLPLSYVISRKIKPEQILFIKTEMIIYSTGIFITWLLTGFWHGAKWTFLLWGMIHAIFLIVHHALRKPRKKLLTVRGFRNGIIVKGTERITMLVVVVISMVFFRVNLVSGGWRYLTMMVTKPFFVMPEEIPLKLVFPVFFLFLVEWIQRDKLHGLDFTNSSKPRVFRWSLYLFLLLMILLFKNNPQQFYYFRF